MANSYFNYKNPVAPGQALHSVKYNGDFSAIERAFDELPDPTALVTSNRNYAVTTGTSTAYMATLPMFDATFGYMEGMNVIVKIHLTNTGPATISVNGLPAVQLTNLTVNNGPLVAGDLRQGAIYSLRFDGVNFQVVNTPSTALVTAKQQAANAQLAAQQCATYSAQVTSLSQSAAYGANAQALLYATTLRVGTVKFFKLGTDPNVAYPGTTWAQVPGANPNVICWERTA